MGGKDLGSGTLPSFLDQMSYIVQFIITCIDDSGYIKPTILFYAVNGVLVEWQHGQGSNRVSAGGSHQQDLCLCELCNSTLTV